MVRVCCHSSASIIALCVVTFTCVLIVCGPLIESFLIRVGETRGCSFIDTIRRRNVSRECVLIYAVQGVYLIMVICMSILSLLMCNGSLMCDLMLSCEEKEPSTGTSPRLRFVSA